MNLTSFAFVLCLFLLCPAVFAQDQLPAEFYSQQVAPLLEQHCLRCHSGARPKSEFDLSYRDGLLQGGLRGSAVDLATPANSMLLKMVSYVDENHQMPPNGKLQDAELQVLRQWVMAGAPGLPLEREAEVEADSEEPEIAPWNYGPLVRPEVPAVKNNQWPLNAIDHFILNRLQQEGLEPNESASAATMVRRATFDLQGLPPDPERVEEYEHDSSPDRYPQLIEELLASPRYGEKWGRHWLDLVRYAETNGYERDTDKPFLWRYRDYVVSAFNNDKPYDQFVKEQIAGDELANVTAETLIATGYYRLMIWDDEPGQGVFQARYDTLDDLVSTTSQVFLGMTVGCARCHDHKKDPIPQTDYYSFMSFFHGITDMSVRDYLVDAIPAREKAVYDLERREIAAKIRSLDQQVGSWKDMVLQRVLDVDPVARTEFETLPPHQQNSKKEQWWHERREDLLSEQERRELQQLHEEREILRRKHVPEYLVAAIQEHGTQVDDMFVHVRGNAHVPGEKVEPKFLSALDPPAPRIVPKTQHQLSSGRRTALADWITDSRQPMTARVMVNRIWQYHFGRGLVESSNDFGALGSGCSHPELLDWLAAEFIARGYSIKSMHRLIMSSRTYQMASSGQSRGLAKDPANQWYWRFDMRRLTAEEMRDSILSVSGLLHHQLGGPSIYSDMPAEVLATSSRPNEVWGKSPAPQKWRRSLYIKVKRSLLPPMLQNFDLADTDASCPVRFVTTQPTQALGLLNSDVMQQMAAAFATRLQQEYAGDQTAQIKRALALALCRQPRQDEVADLEQFLIELQDDEGLDVVAALRLICLTILNLNEFAYLD